MNGIQMSEETGTAELGLVDDEGDGPETKDDLLPTTDMDVPETTNLTGELGLESEVVDEPGVVEELEELDMIEEQGPDEPGPTTPDTDSPIVEDKLDELGVRDGIVDPELANDLDDIEPRDKPDQTSLPKPKTRKRKKKGNKKKKKNDKKRAENKNIKKMSQQLVYLPIVFFLAALSLLLCLAASLRLAH
jgi:hypothetical protein